MNEIRNRKKEFISSVLDLLGFRFRSHHQGRTILGAIVVVALANILAGGTQERVGITEITPDVLVFSTSNGNVVASVGPDGALLVGTPSSSSTASISSILKARNSSPVRYVVVSPEDPAQSEGDAGWGRLGACVAMQEAALERLGGHAMGAAAPVPPRFVELRIDRPRVSFSEVLSFDLNGEAIHIIHQKAGYSNADAITHFHIANVLYFGEVFPGDGYPRIDQQQGGQIAGLLKILDPWTESRFHVVPARGAVTNGESVKAFTEMIVIIRDRIKSMINEGNTEAEIIARHPTSDFDGRWGHGRVSPQEFVHEVYSELIKH
jgi:hypothetical protein